MSEEIRKPGKKKGSPKSGGRKKGSTNKNNPSMRVLLQDSGFNFADELIQAFRSITEPQAKLDALLRLSPYFLRKLAEETEPVTPPTNQQPSPNLDTVPSATLLSLVKSPDGK